MKPLPVTYTIETPRCHLRIVSLADIPHTFSASRHEGFCDGMQWDPSETEEELIPFYHSTIEAWEKGIAYTFTIEDKTTNEFVGKIATRYKENSTWDLGFWTHPAQQGKGYMKEAVTAVIALAFTELAATEVIATHAVWNLASEKVLQHNGMSFIKHIPRGFEKKSGWVELNLLGITHQQWHNSINA